MSSLGLLILFIVFAFFYLLLPVNQGFPSVPSFSLHHLRYFLFCLLLSQQPAFLAHSCFWLNEWESDSISIGSASLVQISPWLYLFFCQWNRFPERGSLSLSVVHDFPCPQHSPARESGMLHTAFTPGLRRHNSRVLRVKFLHVRRWDTIACRCNERLNYSFRR